MLSHAGALESSIVLARGAVPEVIAMAVDLNALGEPRV